MPRFWWAVRDVGATDQEDIADRLDAHDAD